MSDAPAGAGPGRGDAGPGAGADASTGDPDPGGTDGTSPEAGGASTGADGGPLASVRSLPGRIRNLDRRRLLLRAGAATLGVAVLVGVAPWVVPGAVAGAVEAAVRTVSRSGFAGALAVLAAVYGLWTLRGGSTAGVSSLPATADAPERSATPTTPVGTRFERVVESHAADVSDPDEDAPEVREALAAVVVDVLEREAGLDAAAAERAVEAGTWTDDDVAAAFLGGADAPGYPLRSRLRGWVRPRAAYEHRVQRVVDAAHRYVVGDRPPTPAARTAGAAPGVDAADGSRADDAGAWPAADPGRSGSASAEERSPGDGRTPSGEVSDR